MNVPFSSTLPDAVQKALGLPGGADTLEKAIGGILVTVAVMWALLKGLRLVRNNK